MLPETAFKLAGLCVIDTITICIEEHWFLVEEQLCEIDKLMKVVLSRLFADTASAVVLAASATEEDSSPLVWATVYVIENATASTCAVEEAIPMAANGKL